jgi:hypothetical protein
MRVLFLIALLCAVRAHAAPEACAKHLTACVQALEMLAVDNGSFAAGLILQSTTGDTTARSVCFATEPKNLAPSGYLTVAQATCPDGGLYAASAMHAVVAACTVHGILIDEQFVPANEAGGAWVAGEYTLFRGPRGVLWLSPSGINALTDGKHACSAWPGAIAFDGDARVIIQERAPRSDPGRNITLDLADFGKPSRVKSAIERRLERK